MDGAAGAIFAENEALRWLADLAGFPESSGGVFVSGGQQAISVPWLWLAANSDIEQDIRAVAPS